MAALYVTNSANSPVTLAASNTPVIVPALSSYNVTAELNGLTNLQYSSLETQRQAANGTLVYSWDIAVGYATPGLAVRFDGDNATSAQQAVGNASLANIDSKTPAKGVTTSANARPVVRVSDQALLAQTNGALAWTGGTDLSTASLDSDALSINTAALALSIQLTLTGSPVGSFSLQYSDDASSPTNWTTDAATTVSVSGAGSLRWNIPTPGANFVRAVWTKTSGTGTISVSRYTLKGV